MCVAIAQAFPLTQPTLPSFFKDEGPEPRDRMGLGQGHVARGRRMGGISGLRLVRAE